MKTPALTLSLFSTLHLTVVFATNEIGFIEKFALAEDRTAAISELIPGTEDYYFFNALLAQQENRLADVDALLEPWIKRHGTTQRVVLIQNRQALLSYSDDPQKTLAYLKDHLGLAFNHQQTKRGAKPNFPTKIDPARYDPETYLREALKKQDLSGITDAGLDYLIRGQANLTEIQRRDLLRRLQYPDYDRLVGLIAADLRTRESKGFGEFGIHRQLTLAQLDELVGLRPELANDLQFVDTKLTKMRPGADNSLARDPATAEAHYARLWDYVSTLPETFSGLKAAILHRRLELARARGDYPRDLFLAYIRLPRPMPYMEPEYIRSEQRKGINADLNSDFSAVIGIPPIGNDEPIVRDYLENFFLEDDTYARYEPYIREDYLKQVFAETKLLAGIGAAERWFSMLSPAQVQQLKDRVDIEFSPVNKERFDPADEVVLNLQIKNVKELIVKVYKINALNFYLDKKQEINTDIDLDGLVANEEKTYRYETDPILRRTETFPLDSLKNERGIWVIEFIGNGISSRALVRKGKLEYLSQTTPAGELLTLLDDALNPVESGAAWFGGAKYDADKKGRVLLPFSESGNVPVILADEDLASLVKVDLPKEDYKLDLGVLISQETLLPGREAEIAVRPALSLHAEPVPLSKLKDVTLTVSTLDADGVSSSSEVKDFALFDDRESIHKLRVPTRLRSITVTLNGEIPSLANHGEPIQVIASEEFALNGIDSEDFVSDAFLTKIDGKYLIEILGKSGEPISERPVTIGLRHRDFISPQKFSVKTDERGSIIVGALGDEYSLAVYDSGTPMRTWELNGNRYSQPPAIHARVGDTVSIPQVADDGKFDRSDFAIFEIRSGHLVEDVFAKAKAVEGAVAVEGLTAGDYRVLLRNLGKTIDLRVTESEKTIFGYALSKDRHLELENANPLRIASLTRKGDAVEVKVANAGELARVHLVATRYVPEYDPFTNLLRPHLSSPYSIRRGTNESRYVSGRDIGEEYRYILERRGAKKFPGNMLTRPGLILNPWELNETETEIDQAAAGTDFVRSKDMREEQRAKKVGEMEPSKNDGLNRVPQSPSFDFLANQSLFLPNLEIDETGIISISLADLGDRQHIHVVAVDGATTAYRQLSLAEPEDGVRKRDLRLRKTLDRGKDFTQRRNVTLLKDGQTLVIDDLRSSELETYDTIGGIFGTLAGINPDAGLSKFSFLSGWAALDEKQKRSLYSEHASHELNFFLSRKDEDFFQTAVQPYLGNKKDKTFLDHYLLGDPLDHFLQPWEYGRLNIVERILLGRRISEDERERTEKHVASLHELMPKDEAQHAYWFLQALRGRRSDAEGGNFGFDDAVGARGFAYDMEGAVPADGFAAPAAPAAAAVPAPAGDVRDRFAGRAALGLNQKTMPAARPLAESLVAESAPMQLGVDFQQNLAELEDLGRAQVLYRKLETTKEWAENNYYELPIEAQNADLVTVNAFWKDFAEWDGKGGFYSREFPAATRNFTEMMLALSVLNLPFSAEEHEFTVDETELRLTANSPVVVFHEEIQEAGKADGETPILVSQNFFRSDDRYEYEDDGEQSDKFVTDEFITGVVYGSQIVVTNPTSSNHRLDLLVQIPAGAIPVAGSDYTRSYPMGLAPFSTERQEVYFYFPKPSGNESFAVYPVRVSKNEQVITTGGEAEFKVVDSPTNFDEKSWDHISQYGTEKEVLDFLANTNLHRIDLSRIAWRTRESVDFLRSATQLIGSRHAYDPTLWSYGIHHNVAGVVREYLKHREDFLGQCGSWIDCELVSLDPVERHWYQHLEYAPLVNARTHRLGRDRSILNDRFREQYDSFLWLSAYKPGLDADDTLAVAAYLFLQDRIDEALTWLEKVEPDQLATRLQYDYLAAFAALYRGDVAEAGRIATARLEHPVDRWREKFAAVDAQVKEIRGADAAPDDEKTRDGQMEKLGKSDPFLELSATGREAKLNHRNLAAVTVNYYEMDLEFLFSSKPFVSGQSGQFSFVQPNFSEKKDLPEDGSDLKFTVPERFASKNVLVEVVGGGQTDSVAVYSNDLKVQLSGSYGRLEVMDETNGKPLPKTYVKVYARMNDGNVRFFKDGYTDLRGKFDYVSLNTDELENVEELSLLVMSEEHGSLVREVEPPQR